MASLPCRLTASAGALKPPGMSLRDAVLLSLTPRGRELLEQIETYAGQPVNFALYPYPPRLNSTNPTTPATEISHDSATIYIHGTDHSTYSACPMNCFTFVGIGATKFRNYIPR
jgi:hypothetical protein